MSTSWKPPSELIAEREVPNTDSAQLGRQQQTLGSATPPELTVILDEAAIRRPVGGPVVMREQLEYLRAELPAGTTLRIVPLEVGASPRGQGC